MTRYFATFLFSATCLLAAGCGDDDAPAARPTCDAIVAACHIYDRGSGPINECHENAEAETTTEATCTADSANCFALCEAAAAAADSGVDAGAASDAGDAVDAD